MWQKLDLMVLLSSKAGDSLTDTKHKNQLTRQKNNHDFSFLALIVADQDKKTRKTWEHIINDIRINGADNIALCCGSCNASKGNRKLEQWLESKYCLTMNINRESVATVVKRHLEESTTA